MEICAVCEQNPPLIPHVAAPKPLLTLIILLISPRCFCKGAASSLSAEHQAKHILWLHQEEQEKLKLLYYFILSQQQKELKKIVRTCQSPANLSAPGADFPGNTNLLEGPPAAAHS